MKKERIETTQKLTEWSRNICKQVSWENETKYFWRIWIQNTLTEEFAFQKYALNQPEEVYSRVSSTLFFPNSCGLWKRKF